MSNSSSMAVVSLTCSAWSNRFPKGETFFPVGRIGVLVKYPDQTVGVFSSDPQTGELVNRQAIDPIVGRGLFKGYPKGTPANKVEIDRASALVEAGSVLPAMAVRMPRFYCAFDSAVTTDVASLAALERAAGSSNPDLLMKVWYSSLRRWGIFTMIPLNLVEGGCPPERIFECVEGLVDGDGFAVPQLVYPEGLAKENLRIKFIKGRRPQSNKAPTPA
jgi:hypothetical protein